MERFGYGCSRDETFPGSGGAGFGIADAHFLYQSVSSFNLQDKTRTKIRQLLEAVQPLQFSLV
jgi:hypothetical protein